MKILYILHTSELHGSTISILNLILNIKKEIDPIIIIPYSKANSLKDVFIKNDIKFYTCRHIPISIIERNRNLVKNTLSIGRTIIKKILFIIFLFRIILKEKPNIIHTNVGVIYEGARLANLFNIPHVWHLREYQDKDFKWSFFYGKKIFENMLKRSYVICITNDIRNYFNLNNKKSQTIYNGIYHSYFTALEKKDNYFLCASRILPNKGHEEVIRTFALFYSSHPNWKLIIAGDGEVQYISKLKDISKSLNCSNSVIFLGFKKSEAIFNLMKKSAGLIVASLYDGFGRMTAEACFAGTIVIGRYTGGTKEILDIINGYKFLTNDELLAAMDQISKEINTNSYNQKIKSSQKVAQELFSIEQNATNIINLYKNITNK